MRNMKHVEKRTTKQINKAEPKDKNKKTTAQEQEQDNKDENISHETFKKPK